MDSRFDLYDDIYMDLTFCRCIGEKRAGCFGERFAVAFATADYNLWHANQAAEV